ncbi:MAG TPA: hypothetical protein VF041_16915 [Gemmatimonadaceae bacterium]
MRTLLLLAIATVAVLVPARGARAQESAYRFEIVQAGDSTITFDIGNHGWVQAGQQGIAVDPVRRDALVARFRILRVSDGRATALVTGSTTRVTSQHVALVDRPRGRFFTRREFWIGTVLGGAIGAFIAGR